MSTRLQSILFVLSIAALEARTGILYDFVTNATYLCLCTLAWLPLVTAKGLLLLLGIDV